MIMRSIYANLSYKYACVLIVLEPVLVTRSERVCELRRDANHSLASAAKQADSMQCMRLLL